MFLTKILYDKLLDNFTEKLYVIALSTLVGVN